MRKVIRDFKILFNTRLNQDYFILEILSPEPLIRIMPGQFIQVRIDKSKDTFLRRPFSIHDVDYENNIIKLLIQIAGKGTKVLSELLPGENLNVIYPLGNSFSIPELGEKVLLIGGGSGTAPLLFLARYLNEKKITPDILLGFRNKYRIIELEEFSKYGKMYITTEDGSEGFQGLIDEHPILTSNKYDRICCCGPEPMIKKIASYARLMNIFCEVSLENLMACGIGVCLCCVVKTTQGHVCTCTDGPVFNVNQLIW